MNVAKIYPTKQKLRHNRTVAFFPSNHPDLGLLVRRFSMVFNGLFIVRYLGENQTVQPDFFKGWTMVFVGDVLSKEAFALVKDSASVPPVTYRFKGWEDPIFKIPSIAGKTNAAIPTAAPAVVKPVVVPDIVETVVGAKIEAPTPAPVPATPKSKTKPKRPVSANVKKEVVTMTLRTSERLGKVSNEALLAIFTNCQKLYNSKTVKQTVLVKHVLKDHFKLPTFRDPDMEFINGCIVSRMILIPGVKYAQTSASFMKR